MNRKIFGIVVVCLGSLGGCLGSEDPSQSADALLVSPPRRTAPLAGATVSSQRPLVRWATLAPAGLRVEFCADRACALVEQSVRASGRSARAAEGLAPGLHFWRLSVRGRTTSAWSLVVPARDTARSITTGYVPDYNGDGVVDLAISAPGTFRNPQGTAPRGALYLFYGRRPLPSLVSVPDSTLGAELPEGGNAIGLHTVASLGDVNGDGYGDLAVSADDSIFVYHGGPDGLSTHSARFAANSYGSGAGDVNADGYADAIVGHSLYLGGPDGLGSTPAYTWGLDGDPRALGDVNGDGYADVGVFDGSRPVVSLGSAAVFRATTRTVRLAPGFVLRSFVNAGDLNADGASDLACEGDTPDGAAAVFVYFGRAPGYLATADHTVTPSTDRTRPFGAVMSSAGDVNGDGYDDLLIRGDRIPTNEAFVTLYLGGDSALSAAPATTLVGSLSVRYAAALARLGDLDDDGRDDPVVTRQAVSDFVGGLGLVHLGQASGITALPAISFVVGASRDQFAQRLAGWN
jgi:hypothetical protein